MLSIVKSSAPARINLNEIYKVFEEKLTLDIDITKKIKKIRVIALLSFLATLGVQLFLNLKGLYSQYMLFSIAMTVLAVIAVVVMASERELLKYYKKKKSIQNKVNEINLLLQRNDVQIMLFKRLNAAYQIVPSMASLVMDIKGALMSKDYKHIIEDIIYLEDMINYNTKIQCQIMATNAYEEQLYENETTSILNIKKSKIQIIKNPENG